MKVPAGIRLKVMPIVLVMDLAGLLTVGEVLAPDGDQ